MTRSFSPPVRKPFVAKVVFYETGHFALETHAAEIGVEILAFLDALPNS
jgi:hypothetical protein